VVRTNVAPLFFCILFPDQLNRFPINLTVKNVGALIQDNVSKRCSPLLVLSSGTG
jgi:hypothetical protein